MLPVYCNPAYPGTTLLSTLDKIGVKIYYGNMPSINTPAGYTGTLASNKLMVVRIPTLVINKIPYSAILTQTTADTNRDGRYDNVYKLTKTRLTANISTKPASLIGTRLIMPFFKRTIYSSSTWALDGRVNYLGAAEMTQRSDKTFVFAKPVSNFSVQYPISWQ
ncbi:hypothetical protein [Methyloglobulus sp.]|uniref:hypothetical protein n=1 Tax=Methyloglobulus sp. TaxID=2518622 RepID=UPI0032B819C2